MSDEDLNLDLDEENNEEFSKFKSRIKTLSEKVKLTSEERDLLKKNLEEKDGKLSSFEKENNFLKGFSKVASAYNGATEYQDKIWEKVNLGYSVEDATISTLVAEGKFTPPTKEEKMESAAGGSASIGITDKGEKTLKEMSLEEKRQALEKSSISDIFG